MFVTKCFAAIFLALGLLVLVHQVEGAPVKPIQPNFSWLFDEGSGTTAAPQYGTHSGILNGGSSFNNSNTPFAYDGNYAIALDGSTGFVEVADAPELRPGTSAWTTSVWFQAPDANQNSAIMSKRLNSGNFNQWSSFIGNNTTGIAAGKKIQQVLIENNSDRWWYYTTNDILDGEWHHLAIVRTVSGNATMYVDGVAVAVTQLIDNNSEPQDINNTDPWQFGSNNGTGYFMNGMIDEVAM